MEADESMENSLDNEKEYCSETAESVETTFEIPGPQDDVVSSGMVNSDLRKHEILDKRVEIVEDGEINDSDSFPVSSTHDVPYSSVAGSQASPKCKSPASCDNVSPMSFEDENPASPDDVGPASPDDVGPASPDDEGPASPDDEGPASPDDEGLASPDDEGPASPDDEVPTFPDDEVVSVEDRSPPCPNDETGPASPEVATSFLSNKEDVNTPFSKVNKESLVDSEPTAVSEDELPTSSVNIYDSESNGGIENTCFSQRHDATSEQKPLIGGDLDSENVLTHHPSGILNTSKCPAEQEDLLNSGLLGTKNNSENPLNMINKNKKKANLTPICSIASPDSGGDADCNQLESKDDVLSSQWPTNIASSPISDSEEIWDNPSMSENKSDNDDSGSCVKSEKHVTCDVSETSNELKSVSCDSFKQQKRKTRKETNLHRCKADSILAAGSDVDVSENISSSTDAMNSDQHLHAKLDKCSISKERSLYSHGNDIVNKNANSVSESEVTAVAESTTSDDIYVDGKIKRNNESTNFNEEHVELDYEEDVTDDIHGHQNDISKEYDEDGEGKKDLGSEDEKQEGEITDDDEDDGEIDEDEDCEEGEIREPGFRRQSAKPVCRFFLRGSCTWGLNCRFLHPGINDKGNYRLIEMPGFNRTGPLMGPFGPVWGPEMPDEPEPPPPPELPPTESAWERGLRHAKELRKKAQEKKEQETDFEEKRMNLSLDEERELNKDNERSKFSKDPYYDQQVFDDDEYYGKPQAAAWQPGQYENFEVRWSRPDYPPFREEERPNFKERQFNLHMDRVERPLYPPRPRHERRHEKWHHDRAEIPHPAKHVPKGRQADEWHDPWQRTKSPISRYQGSRSDSRGRHRSRRSYSVSSRGSSSSYSTSRSRSSSMSSRSSRSSFSRSSSYSSRSPTSPGVTRPGRQPSSDLKKVSTQSPRVNASRQPDKRMPLPAKATEPPRSAISQTAKHNKRYPDKPIAAALTHSPAKQVKPPQAEINNRSRRPEKVPLPLLNKTRPRSVSSSGSSQSRSRSRSSSSSFSRSRSHSASSISSRSSSSGSSTSSGSADSDHLYRDLQKGQNGDPVVKKIPDDKKQTKAPVKEAVRRPVVSEDRTEHKQKKSEHSQRNRQGSESRVYNSASYRHQSGRAPATPIKPKDPMKLVGQKQSIKLLLVNKGSEKSVPATPSLPGVKRRASEQTGPPAKRQTVTPTNKVTTGEKVIKPSSVVRSEKAKSPPARAKVSVTQAKAPVKPSAQTKVPVPTKPTTTVPTPAPEKPKIKKSTLSRREELLKQLKAVEDAIARKKSKMT